MAKQAAASRLPELPTTASSGRNVLVFHAGALGDFVLTWPILLGAARVLAQCRVMAVVQADKGRLAEQVVKVEYRDVEAGWHKLFGDGDVPEKAAKLLAGARQVISFVAEPSDTWAANVQSLAPGASLSFLRPPLRDLVGMHASEYLLHQLEPDPVLHAATAGILTSLTKTGLMPRLHDPMGPVLLHPGSGSASKNWPIACWLDLAERLRDEGRKVRVILGEVEQERINAGAAKAFESVGDVQRPADLSELLFLMRGAGAYIGHDTGPTHLAAACGLPTTALFGPTDPAVWAPLGPNVRILRCDPLTTLTPADVEID